MSWCVGLAAALSIPLGRVSGAVAVGVATSVVVGSCVELLAGSVGWSWGAGFAANVSKFFHHLVLQVEAVS